MIFLDRTAFYPIGGGQPNDEGSLTSEKGNFKIVNVKKVSGEIAHEVDKEGLAVGDKVRGAIDWNRRYKLSRMHTAAHALSAIFNKEIGCLITGNQLGFEESRIDFDLENFDKEKVLQLAEKANEKLAAGAEIKIYFLPREKALAIPEISKLAGALPPNIPELRIVEIVGIDIQADGGTQVHNTKEIGRIEVIKMENKGRRECQTGWYFIG